jgi:hypothetical protein
MTMKLDKIKFAKVVAFITAQVGSLMLAVYIVE